LRIVSYSFIDLVTCSFLKKSLATKKATITNVHDTELYSAFVYIVGFGAFASIIGYDLATFMPMFFAFLISYLSVGTAFFIVAHFLWAKTLSRFDSRFVHELASRRLVEIQSTFEKEVLSPRKHRTDVV